jgi:hypothetical protein
MRYPVFIPVLGYVQAAEAAPELLDIRLGVHTGAKDVLVQVVNAGSQPAWAGCVTVAIHVDEQAFQKVTDHLLILVEMKTLLGHQLLKLFIIGVNTFRTYGVHTSLSSMQKLYICEQKEKTLWMNKQMQIKIFMKYYRARAGCTALDTPVQCWFEIAQDPEDI